MPVAASAEELTAQLHEIELMNDRTPLQRNYLAQKVQTRYWMQQVVGMGQASELQEWVQEGTPKKMTNQAQALYSMYTWDEDRKAGAFTPDEVVNRWNTGYDYYDGKRNWDRGYAMPWQNAGESYMPTLTGSLAGSSAKDYMSNYRAKAYDRLTEEAAENTTKWIERTGKLDPNLKIQGIDYILQDGGIYRDTSDGDFTQVLDEYTGELVDPGKNSKWTEFDVDSGSYKLTPEGTAQVDKEKNFARLIEEHGLPDALTKEQRAELERIRRLRLGAPAGTGEMDEKPTDEEIAQAEEDVGKLVEGDDALARRIKLQSMGFDSHTGHKGVDAVTKTPGDYGSYGKNPFGDDLPTGEEYKGDEAGDDDDMGDEVIFDPYAGAQMGGGTSGWADMSGMGDDFGYDMQYQDYDLPEGWRWDQAYGTDADVWRGGIYYAPDGSRFGDSGKGPVGIDEDNWGTYYNDYVDVIKEAQKRLDDEKKRDAEEAGRRAQEQADLEAYRDKVDRLAEGKERRHREYLAKQEAKWARWDRDAQKRARFEESQKGIRTKGDIEAQRAAFQREDEENWRKQGIALGLLDPDLPRPTETQSHVPDVVPTHLPEAEHVTGDHPLHSFSAGALGVLNAWGRPTAVKVV